MNFRQRLGSLLRSEDGTIAVISVMVMTVMIGFAAIAVDIGSIHYDSRRLQGAADLAAIAAASNTARSTSEALISGKPANSRRRATRLGRG